MAKNTDLAVYSCKDISTYAQCLICKTRGTETPRETGKEKDPEHTDPRAPCNTVALNSVI